MLKSTRSMKSALAPPLRPQQPMWKLDNTEPVMDITKSRELLKQTSDGALTPRKRALARKASGLTPTTPVSAKTSPAASVNSSKGSFSGDERTTLFQFDKAEIFSFEELQGDVTETHSQGRLLGHGKFEVFQLHQKKVSYIQCGSVVYPILPKLKMLKISPNQLILPLSNPERYWRIVIDTANDSIMRDLENVFKSICQFRNLYIQVPAMQKSPLLHQNGVVDRVMKKEPQSRIKSSASSTSISTAVACLNLESDTSTYVDEKPSLHRTDSHASSLDAALDSFMQDDLTNYYTPDASFAQTLEPPIFAPLDPSSLVLKRKPQSRSSMSASLYQSESSWMDPSDDMNTSTPNTKRYIRMNLNPRTQKEKRVVTEPILGTSGKRPAGYRYSSYDVFNILSDSTEADTSLSGFFKSFF